MFAPGTPDSPAQRTAGDRGSKLMLGLLLVLVAGCLALLLPFWPSLVLALWTSYLTRPLVDRLTRAIHGRRGAAALVTVGILIVASAPLLTGIAVVAPDAIDLGQRALASKSGFGALRELVSGEGQGSLQQGDKAQQIADMVQAHGQQAWTATALLAGALGRTALGVFIYLVATFAAMVQGEQAYLWLRQHLPIADGDTDRLRDAFHETGKGLLYSVALTALMIAVLATIAYVSLGLPRPLALGMATLIAALIPAVGPFLVWGPISLGLLLAGHPIKALILVGVCVVLVAPVDHLVRPFLARRGKLQLNSFVVFLSMIGGIVSIGGWGLILGPLLYRMTLEVLALVREPSASQQTADARGRGRSSPALSPGRQ